MRGVGDQIQVAARDHLVRSPAAPFERHGLAAVAVQDERGNRHLGHDLQPVRVEIAWTAVRHDGYLKSLYDRHVARNGGYRPAARARRSLPLPAIRVIVWHVLTTGKPYDDLGSGYFDRRTDSHPEAQRLIARLEALGRTSP